MFIQRHLLLALAVFSGMVLWLSGCQGAYDTQMSKKITPMTSPIVVARDYLATLNLN